MNTEDPWNEAFDCLNPLQMLKANALSSRISEWIIELKNVLHSCESFMCCLLDCSRFWMIFCNPHCQKATPG